MKKKLKKIRIIFDKQIDFESKKLAFFWSLDLERTLIWQSFLWKSAIFHSIKLPFDAEVDEIFLNVIYYLSQGVKKKL